MQFSVPDFGGTSYPSTKDTFSERNGAALEAKERETEVKFWFKLQTN